MACKIIYSLSNLLKQSPRIMRRHVRRETCSKKPKKRKKNLKQKVLPSISYFIFRSYANVQKNHIKHMFYWRYAYYRGLYEKRKQKCSVCAVLTYRCQCGIGTAGREWVDTRSRAQWRHSVCSQTTVIFRLGQVCASVVQSCARSRLDIFLVLLL